MNIKKYFGLLLLLLTLTVILPSCKQKDCHKEGKCCKKESCENKCAEKGGCKCDSCEHKCADKEKCSCDKACCKEKCCGGEQCDDCKKPAATDSLSATGAAKAQGPGGSAADAFETAKYFCPMKCEGGFSDKPGKCKVCGMDLKERK